MYLEDSVASDIKELLEAICIYSEESDTLGSIKLYDMQSVFDLRENGERYSAIRLRSAAKKLLTILT